MDTPRPRRERPATIDDLRCSQLFDGLSDQALADNVMKSSIVRRLKTHQRLEPSRGAVEVLHVILSGYVAVWAPSRLGGAEETFLAWRGPGQIIGEMRLLGADVPQARVDTCEPCEVIEIRRDTFTDLAGGVTLVYRNIARLLVLKMAQERSRSEIIRMRPVVRRVAQLLLHLWHERRDDVPRGAHDGMKIPGVLHQDEMGEYIGVSRETVNRDLHRLIAARIISYEKISKGGQITILDIDDLGRVARGELKLPPLNGGDQSAAGADTLE